MSNQRVLPHEHKPHRVYVLRDRDRAVLYIGVSSQVERRIKTHLKTQPWADEIDAEQTVVMEEMPWEQALALEQAAIQKYRPRHNKRSRNGTAQVAAGVRAYLATEARLYRAALTGDPAATAALQEWRSEQARLAAEEMRRASGTFQQMLARAVPSGRAS